MTTISPRIFTKEGALAIASRLNCDIENPLYYQPAPLPQVDQFAIVVLHDGEFHHTVTIDEEL